MIYKGQLYIIVCLPFGLSTAPAAFSSLNSWLADALRKRGIRVLVYLDDFSIAYQDPGKLSEQRIGAGNYLQDLGRVVNMEKSVVTPTHRIEFLGVAWHTRRNTGSLAIDKKERIRKLLNSLLVTNTWSWKGRVCWGC